jgi:hypothetical protein
MESETIPSEEHKTDSPFGATLFKLPFKQKYRTNVHVTHKQFLSQKGIKNHG